MEWNEGCLKKIVPFSSLFKKWVVSGHQPISGEIWEHFPTLFLVSKIISVLISKGLLSFWPVAYIFRYTGNLLAWISGFMEAWCQLSCDALGVWDPVVEEETYWEIGGSTHLEFKYKFRAPEGGMEVKLSQAGYSYFSFCVPYLKHMSAGDQVYSTGIFCSVWAVVSIKSSRMGQRSSYLRVPNQWKDMQKIIPLVVLSALLIVWKPSLPSCWPISRHRMSTQ